GDSTAAPPPPGTTGTTPDLAAHRVLHENLDRAVVHPDLVAGPQIFQTLRMRDRGLLHRAHHRAGVQRERLARLEVDAAAAARTKGAEPYLRALEVLKDRDAAAPARLALANALDDLGVLLLGTGGEVAPTDPQ